jgi:hypothetical protein
LVLLLANWFCALQAHVAMAIIRERHISKGPTAVIDGNLD